MPEIKATVRGAHDLPPDATVLNERSPDVSPWTRLKLKAWAANPEAAADYLRRNGLEAYVIPSSGMLSSMLPKMQLAIRNPKAGPDAPFYVIDPDGLLSFGGLRDLPEDIADTLWDTFVTGPIVGWAGAAGAALGGLLGIESGPGAAATGAAGAMAAGGLGARGAELFRQGMGQVAGINQGVDQGMVNAATFGGAVAPAVGEAIGSLARGVGGAIAEKIPKAADSIIRFLAKFTNLDPRQLQMAATSPEIQAGTAPTVDRTLANLNAFLNTYTSEELLPETVKARTILAAHGTQQVPARPILEALEDALKKLTAIPSAAVIPAVPARAVSGASASQTAVNQTLKLIKAIVGASGATDFQDAIMNNRTLPLDIAQTIKTDWAKQAGYSKGATDPGVKATERIFRDAYGGMKEAIRRTLPSGAFRDAYDSLMAKSHYRMGLMEKMRDKFRFIPSEGAEQLGQAKTPETTIRNYLSKPHEKLPELVQEFDNAFSPEIAGWNQTQIMGNTKAPLFSQPFDQQMSLASTNAATGGRLSYAPSRLTVMAGIPGAFVGTLPAAAAHMLGAPPEVTLPLGAFGGLAGIRQLGTARGAAQTTRGLMGAAEKAPPFGQALQRQATPFLTGTAAAAETVPSARGAETAKRRAAAVANISNITPKAMATLNGIAQTLQQEKASHPEWDDAAIAQEFYKRATGALQMLNEPNAVVDLQTIQEPATANVGGR